MKPSFNSLINKYGLLVSIFYLGTILIDHINFIPDFLWLPYYFITNIIIAMIVWNDLRNNDFKSPITIWATILFDILGVVLLLLRLIRKEKTSDN
jgi:hypothetical protein